MAHRRIRPQVGDPAERHPVGLEDLQDVHDRARAAGRVEPGLEAFRWLLEELSVSLFAQELKTPFPVSYKRVERAWADLDRRR